MDNDKLLTWKQMLQEKLYEAFVAVASEIQTAENVMYGDIEPFVSLLLDEELAKSADALLPFIQYLIEYNS